MNNKEKMASVVGKMVDKYCKSKDSQDITHFEHGRAGLIMRIINDDYRFFWNLDATEQVEAISRFFSAINADLTNVFAMNVSNLLMSAEQYLSINTGKWFNGDSLFISKDGNSQVNLSEVLKTNNYQLYQAELDRSGAISSIEVLSKEEFLVILQRAPKASIPKNGEFSITCKCGASVSLYKKTKEGEESSYSDSKGWYLTNDLFTIEMGAKHKELKLWCNRCGNEGWHFV